MEIIYSPNALKHIEYWKKSGQISIQKKITVLLNDIVLHPKTGIGKPEELKYNWKNCWSRRINDEHRIIYEFDEDNIYIHSLKGHY